MPPVPLLPAALRWTLDRGLLAFEVTAQVAPTHLLPGQPAGRRALAEAVLSRRGGHLVVTGLRGAWRRQALADAVRDLAPARRGARDLVYVARPFAPDRACLLELPAGRGVPFRRALRNLRDELRVAWPDDLDGDASAYSAAQQAVFGPLRDAFPGAAAWLDQLALAVAARSELFRPGVDPARRAADGDVEARDLLAAFQAHLFHAAGPGDDAPVVVVADPSPSVLAGGVARGRREDPDHLALRSGLLHDAHGGFLVVDAADLVRTPGALRILRAVVATGQAALGTGPGQPAAVTADPVPLDLRLVVVAGDAAGVSLFGDDPDLSRVFHQPVQLDPRPEVDAEVLTELAGWLEHRGRATGRRPLAAEAFAVLVEDLVRQGGRGGRVPLDLDVLEALAEDADAHARGERIEAGDVHAALLGWGERRALAGFWARRAILEDFVHVATDGLAEGQVNGLAVYRSSGFPHARPIRITATVGAGRGGFVDVERDVGLAGNTHNKGVRMLRGFLQGHFSRRRTLAIQANLGIEQHYGRIDGDSASAAELCALLSALGRVPMRQDRALTGSVDQLGRLRSVGSVTLKVEGFFALCEARGLTGEQGVIVPESNIGDLCLSEEVVAACQQGRFHVWPAATIEQALSLLCGLEVGEPGAESWPPETLYGRIAAELDELERVVRRAAKGPGSQ